MISYSSKGSTLFVFAYLIYDILDNRVSTLFLSICMPLNMVYAFFLLFLSYFQWFLYFSLHFLWYLLCILYYFLWCP